MLKRIGRELVNMHGSRAGWQRRGRGSGGFGYMYALKTMRLAQHRLLCGVQKLYMRLMLNVCTM